VHCKFIIRAPSLCRGRIQRKTWSMGPNAGVDYDLTLCPLQSRLQHITLGNPMPESTLTLDMPEVDFIPQLGTLGLASVQCALCSSMQCTLYIQYFWYLKLAPEMWKTLRLERLPSLCSFMSGSKHLVKFSFSSAGFEKMQIKKN
jgi:hypothetical protein